MESANIKRAIETVYSTLLPKGGFPFVYLSLEIDPKNVDVNVHPTKKEVHFLHEDKIVDSLIDAFQETLENANESRTFLVQTLLPGASDPKENDEGKKLKKAINNNYGIAKLISTALDFAAEKSTTNGNGKSVAEYHYVRTDSTRTTMHRFLNNKPSIIQNNESMDVDADNVTATESTAPPQQQQIEVTKRPRVEVRLGSVLQLRKEIKKEESPGT